MSKRAATRRQVDALREQRTMAERLRVWRDGRRAAADDREAKRRKAERKAARKSKGERGVDRVPEHLRIDPPRRDWIVEHEHPNYRWRRNRSLFYGSGLATGRNVPHTNPARDKKPNQRLRTELR